MLYRGQIMETGPVEAVNSEPRHPYTVALTAAAPVPRPAEQAARRAAREALGVGTAGAAQPAATGCPFVPRCPLATDVCVAERPPLRLVDGTLTACHHAERVPRSVASRVRHHPEPRRTVSSSRALTDADLDALVGKLDLETKVRLLSGAGAWTLEEVPEIGLRTLTVSDGPVGVRGGTDTELEPSAALPSGSGMAATWDEELLGRIGRLLAGEAVRKGVDVVLGPTINLHRSPLGGRHFECFSEDPLLSGRLATAYVRGVQEQGIGACPKHYVANDAETDRFTVDNRVDERTLRELYLAPFEAVVADADPWMVMAAYNAVNGTPDDRERPARRAAEGRVGLRRRGRLRLGRHLPRRAGRPRRARPDHARPGAAVARAAGRGGPRRAACREAAIDEKVRRILRLAARAGALDGVEPAGEKPAAGRIEDAAPLAREAAAAAAVLLRNDGHPAAAGRRPCAGSP